MMTRLSLVLFIPMSLAVGQADSLHSESHFRFSPTIRTLALEASTVFIFAGAFGITADVDLLELPYETVPRVGLRFSSQEINRGLLGGRRNADNVFGELLGGFIRGTHHTGNTRSDIFIGVIANEFTSIRLNERVTFGADIRWIFFRPLGSLFVRIIGNRSGMAVLFGISVGYVN